MIDRAPLSGRVQQRGCLVVMAIVLGFVSWDAVVRGRHVLDVSITYGVTVDAPRADPRSATGYEQGRRSLILPAGSADTAHWIMQTQAMIATSDWRIRKVDYDNAPAGREVHWAAPFHWWLALLAGVDHLLTDRPAGISVERATLYSGPVMFGLLVVALLLPRSRLSGTATALFLIGAVAAYPFYVDFLPARADHHGLANVCALATLLCLSIGSTGDMRSARRWIIRSAIAGAAGMWISAATQIPVLIGAGVGILAAGWIGRGPNPSLTWLANPNLLRTWGRFGAGGCLVAYLIEYFPSDLGWRLEVNHPLHAIAWLGAGEMLRAIALARGGNASALRREDRIAGTVGAIAVVVVPAVILLTAGKTFVVVDPFVWRIHSLHISEFQGLARYYRTAGINWNSAAIVLPVALLAGPAWLLFNRSTRREVKPRLALALVLPGLAWVLGVMQIRWLGLAYATSLPALNLFFQTLTAGNENRTTARRGWLAFGGLALAPGLIHAVRGAVEAAEFTPVEIRSLAERDVAQWLRLRAGAGRVTIAATPSPTTRLIYHGSLQGLGTLYWENAAGLKNAAALMAAPSSEAAHEIARRLGVTHLVLFSWDAFEVVQARLYRGLPESAAMPPDLFIAQLLTASVPPPWLRAIPFSLPDHVALAGQQVRIWEVVPDQTPAEAAAHAASFYLESKKPDLAARLVPTLADARDDLVASVMLAAIASRQRDAATFSAAQSRILAQLRQAPALSLADHINLVVVLAVGDQVERAREQLRAAVTKVDAASLRQLTPGTLSDLLALCEALGVDLPDPALRRTAEQLIPPAQRR